MIEYVMRYNIDETGKMINARRMEELIRCKNCRNFGFCKDNGCKDNDFCSYANKKVEHYCNNCRYKNVSWREEPCLTCARGDSRWEAEEG